MTTVFNHGEVSHEIEFPPPESVAPIVVFLARNASSHLHGQVLSFDGTALSVWSHPEAAVTWTRPGGWTPGMFGAALAAEAMERPHPDRWGIGIKAAEMALQLLGRDCRTKRSRFVGQQAGFAEQLADLGVVELAHYPVLDEGRPGQP